MKMKERESGVGKQYWKGTGKDTSEGYVLREREAVIQVREYRANRCARRMEVTVTGLEAVVVVPLRQTGLS